MFNEQVGWAVDADVDFMIGETFSLARGGAAGARDDQGGEHARGGDARHPPGPDDARGLDAAEACRRLEEAGADVVGLNCSRGPATMLPLIAQSALP